MEQLILGALGLLMVARGTRGADRNAPPLPGPAQTGIDPTTQQPVITDGTTTVTEFDLSMMGLNVRIEELTQQQRQAALTRKAQDDENARLKAVIEKAKKNGEDYTTLMHYESCAGGYGVKGPPDANNADKCEGLPFWNYEPCRAAGFDAAYCAAFPFEFYESCRQIGFSDKACAAFPKLTDFCKDNPENYACTRFGSDYGQAQGALQQRASVASILKAPITFRRLTLPAALIRRTL